MAEIQLNHVYKKFDDGVTAVKNFTLDIQDRDFVVFVGPSGCGKSTTLRMIAGLEKISDGTLVIDGKKMNDVQSCDRDIAMVFQNYALYPHMTVAENMAYSLRLKHVPKKERRQKVEEVAKILGLEDYGLEIGKNANLVILDATDVREAIRLDSDRLYVIRKGKVVAQTERETKLFI